MLLPHHSSIRGIWQLILLRQSTKAYAITLLELTIIHLSSHTNLAASDIPPIPGMTVEYHYQRQFPLNPLGIYLSAIELMYYLSRLDWNAPISGDVNEWLDAYNVRIMVLRTADANVLHNSHVVLALLGAINDMSSKNAHCEFFVYISLDRRQIGIIAVGPKDGLTQRLTADKERDGPRSLTQNDTTSTNYAPLTLSSEIIDPAFQSVHIEYQTDGDAIGARYVFLMVLDGMAQAAQFSPHSHCSGFHAMDPDLHAVFHISPTHTGRFKFQYSVIVRTLYLLFGDILLDKSRFHEMSFQLVWDGLYVAQGSVTDLSIKGLKQGVDVGRR